MLSASKKRILLGGVLALVLLLFAVPYINVSRYRESAANSLTQALGHKVTIREISLQGFPQPGLLLKGVVVADDPAISAEPMLHDDDEVLATLRFTSLWRGRLEISSLKMRYPSINLVRGTDGRWNLESLLERARQAPAAPTVNKRPETRIRFPYIEATGARINLKLGQEKTVFALGEADFALWLASEDEWRMRLKARPIRTDANLTDTGTLKAEGSWHRAAQLRDTPLTFRLWWDYAQFGQLTTLLYGHDRGWRGTVRASAIVQGRPENLQIISTGRVEDFRRYDIPGGDAITLQAKCDAVYSLSEKQFNELYCESPAGGGKVAVKGSFTFPGKPHPQLDLSAESVSMQFLSGLAQHVRTNVPQDIAATGVASGVLTLHPGDNSDMRWTGSADTSEVQLRSSVLSTPLQLEATHWKLAGPGTDAVITKAKQRKSNLPRNAENLQQLERLSFVSQPISLKLGAAAPATVSASLNREGYSIDLKGDVELGRTIEIGRLLGIPTTSSELSGPAKGSLRLAGDWTGGTSAHYLGEAQVQKITAKVSGVASPIKIATAHFLADERSLSLTKVSATVEGVHSKFDFSATWPRDCSASANDQESSCALKFDAKADQLNVDELNTLLNPKAQKQPWYAALTGPFSNPKRTFPALHADGTISAAKLVVKSVIGSHATAELRISPAGFAITNFRADVLGGSYAGDVVADFTGNNPSYTSTGNVVDISVSNVGTLMHDGWASGNLTGAFKFSGNGWSASDIATSATGSGTFDWRDGALSHIDPDGHGKPLQFKDFKGILDLKKGVLSIAQSKLHAGKSIYLVSGTASLGRELELKFSRDGEPGFSVSGTLERPKVVPEKVPTPASLKQKSR